VEKLIKETFFYTYYRYWNAEYIRFTLRRHVVEEVHWVFYGRLVFMYQGNASMRPITCR